MKSDKCGNIVSKVTFFSPNTGGTLAESQLVHGVAFKKTFSYAGFDMQPKKFETPKIALLNIELEVKSVRENAEIRVSNLKDYQDMVDAEYKVTYGKIRSVLQFWQRFEKLASIECTNLTVLL